MNIALLLHGIAKSKTEYEPHPVRGWDSRVEAIFDYSKSLKNYRDFIIDENNVDVFLHTYNTEMLDKKSLVKSYNPKSYLISEPLVDKRNTEKRKRTNSRKKSILESIKCLEGLENNYDYIVVTRYDLHFEEKFLDIVDKMNVGNSLCVPFMVEKEGLVDDNLFIFKPNRLKDFKETVNYMYEKVESNNMHNINEMWKKVTKEEVTFLVEGKYHIYTDNPLYHIVKYVKPIGVYEKTLDYIKKLFGLRKRNYEFVAPPKKKEAKNCMYCSE